MNQFMMKKFLSLVFLQTKFTYLIKVISVGLTKEKSVWWIEPLGNAIIVEIFLLRIMKKCQNILKFAQLGKELLIHLTGLPIVSCAENWEELRRFEEELQTFLRRYVKTLHKIWGDFIHVCSSRSYFYWCNEQ